MLFGDSRMVVKDFFDAHSSMEHLQNLPDHNSCALESRSPTANFAVRNNVFVDFNSHTINNDNPLFKSYDNGLGRWIEVRYLKVGDEIAVPDYSTGAIKWEKIASIKTLEPQHVYDLSIEGTRNFIANDIVAHNTYLATSSGNVGIGTTSPKAALNVVGDVYHNLSTATKDFEIVNGSGTSRFFIDNSNGRIGIGTSSPNALLNVAGSIKYTDTSEALQQSLRPYDEMDAAAIASRASDFNQLSCSDSLNNTFNCTVTGVGNDPFFTTGFLVDPVDYRYFVIRYILGDNFNSGTSYTGNILETDASGS